MSKLNYRLLILSMFSTYVDRLSLNAESCKHHTTQGKLLLDLHAIYFNL